MERISFLSFARVRAKTGGGGGARRRVMEGWRKKREREREKERVRSISPRVLPRSFPALSTSIKLSWMMSGGEALEKYESSNRE